MALQYRQLQSPAQLDTSVPDNGSAATAQALSSLLEVSDTAYGIGADMAKKRGEDAGAIAGASGNPAQKTGFLSQTIESQAYNNAAEAAYVSKTQIDAVNSFSKFEQDNPGSLAGYQATANEYLRTLQKQTPPEFWAKLGPMLEGRAQAGALRVHQQEITDQHNDQQNSYLKGADARMALVLDAVPGPEGDKAFASAVQDNSSQVDALLKDRIISPEQADEYRRRFTTQLHAALDKQHAQIPVNAFMSFARNDVEQGDKLFSDFMSDPKIDAETKVKVSDEYRKQRSALEFERARTLSGEAAGVAKTIGEGGYGLDVEGQLHSLYKRAGISPDEFRSLTAAIGRNQTKAVEEGAGMAAVQNAISTDTALDPKNPKHVKAANDYFTSATQKADVVPGTERWVNAAAEMAKHTGILPSSAEAWVRQSLIGGDPVQAATAASAYVRFRDANSAASAFENDPKIAALAQTIYDNTKAGMDPVTAYTSATATLNAPPEIKEAYKKQYEAGKYESANSDWIRSNVFKGDPAFDTGRFSNNAPPVPVALQAEFERSVRQYYQTTGGDIVKARTLAGHDVTRGGLWGVSSVNGQREVMKYAPEVASGLTTEEVRASITDFVKRIAVPSPEGHGTTALVDPALVVLKEAPGLTERTHGQAWYLGIPDQYGAPDVLRGPDGRKLVFTLPDKGTAFDLAQAAARKASIEALTRAREEQTRMQTQFDQTLNSPQNMVGM